jgi:hypothetical protein
VIQSATFFQNVCVIVYYFVKFEDTQSYRKKYIYAAIHILSARKTSFKMKKMRSMYIADVNEQQDRKKSKF